ncbi:hypothetical protein mRhiFer1_009038 [Rhinolophus ferrumequinum]|uniref:Uncharacterized protein n=1 Tax=Rhinolophus ferrumequinum TaxID=59479 RepID=A0A7J7SXP9_RHIFE|nr:hypothetical protein mRhiFer1_009038 [Rhinolophus ferrumequinum]
MRPKVLLLHTPFSDARSLNCKEVFPSSPTSTLLHQFGLIWMLHSFHQLYNLETWGLFQCNHRNLRCFNLIRSLRKKQNTQLPCAGKPATHTANWGTRRKIKQNHYTGLLLLSVDAATLLWTEPHLELLPESTCYCEILM